jgi:hypothetical protein
MARTPRVIAAQNKERMKMKRKKTEVSLPIEKKNEEDLFHKLLNLNHDLATVKKQTAKMQIDLSTMLKMNNNIAKLSKEISIIQNDLSDVLSKWEESIPRTVPNKKMRNELTDLSSSSESDSSDSEGSKEKVLQKK